MLSRTAKSCGPDAPTLASSFAEVCWPDRAVTKPYSADDGGKRARSPGRARHKPLKPLRAGMPGDSGVLVVTRVRSTNTKCTRGRGCNGHPAFPTPSKGRELHAQLGRIARRGCEVAFGIGLLKIEPAAKYEPAIASAVAARERGCDLILRSAPWRASRRMVARVHGSCPSFETLASQAPQDEVGILHRLESGRSSIPRRE